MNAVTSSLSDMLVGAGGGAAWLKVDALSEFVGVFCALFFGVILIYSFGYRRHIESFGRHVLYLFLTLVFALGAVFAAHLVVFVVCWGILALLLYLMIALPRTSGAAAAAIKAFIIVGATDAFMLLGLGLLWRLTGTLNMAEMHAPLTGRAAIVAYLCLASGALAKAGAMPFHTWAPDMAEHAAIPATAYLPASLDKLLGIYFLARISMDVFVMTPGMNTLLMAIGSFTIVAAVMMALIQHDMTRLLGYHAVSQVGYMVLGIGTGSVLGIAGGLFHMLNHTIYKSCLFLTAGAVKDQMGTTDLEHLGGLARFMPITFTSFFIAALAISGVPPLNGFASKWMVYQALIERGESGPGLWIVFLICAMFGSALTLASFMKLAHAVFLGQRSPDAKRPKEVSALLWGPCAALALICVVFGLFPYGFPLKLWIEPSVGATLDYSGVWQPGAAAAVLVAALLVGLALALWAIKGRIRVVEPFVGGESLQRHPEMRLSGVAFYDSVRALPLIGSAYQFAEAKAFDIYDAGAKFCFGVSHGLSAAHTGVLPRYVLWSLIGLVTLLALLMR